MLGLALAVVGCGPPQIGPDDKAFKTVDALYTAVSMREPVQLERCERTLKDLAKDGKLPDATYRSLEQIIIKARNNQWDAAAEDLRWFMKGQHS